eukprot:403350773
MNSWPYLENNMQDIQSDADPAEASFQAAAIFPGLSQKCSNQVILTGFDVDKIGNQVLTGQINLDSSCSQASEQESYTFLTLFDIQGETQIYSEASLIANNFINPLIKSSCILALNKIGDSKMQIVKFSYSQTRIYQATLELFSSAQYLESDKQISNQILMTTPDGASNSLLISFVDFQYSHESYIITFDDAFATRKIFKIDQEILTQRFQVLTCVLSANSDVLINIQYTEASLGEQQHYSGIVQLDSKYQPIPQFSINWRIPSEIFGFSKLLLSDTQNWYLAYSSTNFTEDFTNVVSSEQTQNNSQILKNYQVPLLATDFDLFELQPGNLIISGFVTHRNDKNSGFYCILLLDLNQKFAKILATTQDDVDNIQQSNYYIRFLNNDILVAKSTNQFTKDHSDRRIQLYKINIKSGSNNENIEHQYSISVEPLEKIEILQTLIRIDEIQDKSQIMTSEEPVKKHFKSTSRQLTTYTLSDGTQTENTLSYSISTTGSITNTLTLNDGGGNVAIDSITYGDDTALDSQDIPITFSTSTLTFNFNNDQLAEYIGVRTLNVKVDITGTKTTVAYIQIVILLPDTTNNGNIANATSAITYCGPTFNPFFFGNYSGNFGDIKVRYVHSDTRGNLMVAGESTQMPFHDGSTNKAAGFFGIYNTAGNPFWIYRLQEDLPTGYEKSSCFLLGDIQSNIYAACNVRNLQSAGLESRNVIVKVAKSNGKFIYMKQIYQEAETSSPSRTTSPSNEESHFAFVQRLSTSDLPTQAFEISNADGSVLRGKIILKNYLATTPLFQKKVKMANEITSQDKITLRGPLNGIYGEKRLPVSPLIDGNVVPRGVSFADSLKGTVPCYSGMPQDSQFYFPCLTTQSGGGGVRAKVYAFKIDLAGQGAATPAFNVATSAGLVIELQGDVNAGEMISVSTSGIVTFYATTVSTKHIIAFPITVSTFKNTTLTSWYYGFQMPTGTFSLVRTLTNQPNTGRRYYAVNGQISATDKQSSIIFSNGAQCISFNGGGAYLEATSLNSTVVDTALQIGSFIQDITSVNTHITTTSLNAVAATTASQFTTAQLYRLTSQSYSMDPELKYQWGYGSLPFQFTSSSNFSTRLCGAYGYINETFDFQYLDLPLDLYVYSPQKQRNDPNPITQSWITVTTDGQGVRSLNINPDPETVMGQNFNLNVTFVDRYDGRVANEISYVIRFNRDNSVNFPTTSYFECAENIFPFSYGDSCTDDNCGLSIKGHYYDSESSTMLLMGGVQQGFSKLQKVDTSKTKSDAFIMKINAFGIVLWMNQYRQNLVLSEHATSATIYNETYVMVSVRTDITDPAYSNINQYTQVFAKFDFLTGQYNGTIMFTRVNAVHLLIPPNSYSTAVIAQVSNMVSYTVPVPGSPTLYRIMASVMLRHSVDTTKVQPGFMIFHPTASVNSTYIMNLNGSPVNSLTYNTLGTIYQDGNDAYYGTTYDFSVESTSTFIQYIGIARLTLDAIGSSPVFYTSASTGRFIIGREPLTSNRIMRPPALLDIQNGKMIAATIVYRTFKVFDITVSSFTLANEYTITLPVTIYEFSFVRVPYLNQYALVTNERDTDTQLKNYQGLLIIILDATFNQVKAFRTGLTGNFIPRVFTPTKLTADNSLYYVYGITNYAYTGSTNGNEILVGNINFENTNYDDNECISYTSQTMTVTTVKVTTPQSRGSTTYSNPLTFGIIEVYTPLVWQVQYSDTRQIMPQRKKESLTMDGLTYKDSCETSFAAISKPLQQVLTPAQGNLGAVTPFEKTAASSIDTLSTCQGLQTSIEFDTQVDTKWENQNEFLTLANTKITYDLSKDQPALGIREIGLSQCLIYDSQVCQDQYLPLAIKPSSSLDVYEEQAYGCANDFPNEYPKVLGEYSSDFKVIDQDYDHTNDKMAICGQQSYQTYQNADFQTFTNVGVIILYQTSTDKILWSNSLASTKTTYKDSSFQGCQFSTESTVPFIISLVYLLNNNQYALLKQSVTDGLYIKAHFLPGEFTFKDFSGLLIDKSTADIYVNTYANSGTNSHQIIKIQQKTRGFQMKWEYYVTNKVSTYTQFQATSLVKFNNEIYYAAQLQIGASTQATLLQSITTLDGTNKVSKYFAFDDTEVHDLSLSTDNTNLVFSSVAVKDTSDYYKTIRVYNIQTAALTFVSGVQYPVDNGDLGSRSSSIISTTYIIDSFYSEGGVLNILVLLKADLTVHAFKKLDKTITLSYASLAMNTAETELYFYLTSTNILHEDYKSGVIHKLSNALISENTCFTLTDLTPGDVTVITENLLTTPNPLTIDYGQLANSFRLLPATDLYLESKIQYRDIDFKLAKIQGCKPYALEFYEDLPQVDITVGAAAQVVSIDQTDLCVAANVVIKVTVDYYLEVPTFITINNELDPTQISINPTSETQVGLYSLRITYKYNDISTYRSMLINVKPANSPTGAAQTLTQNPVLFHLHKEGANYFIAGDIQSDGEYFVVCGNRILYYQQSFFQQYDKFQKLLFQHNLGSGLYDSFTVDCKYSADDNLFNMINSYTTKARVQYSIYLYKHDDEGYFINSKQLEQIGQNIYGDGFSIKEDTLLVFGRTNDLLGYSDMAPFIIKMTTDFDIQIYKTIRYNSESTIKYASLGSNSDLYGIMGTKDASNSDTKSWIIMSFNSDSFYENWSYILKDTTKISIDYEDYGSPVIKTVLNTPIACLYYQYSYTPTSPLYETALIRINPEDGTILSSLEWKFTGPVQACSFDQFTTVDEDTAIAVSTSTSTQTFINLFKVEEAATNVALTRLTTSTNQVFTLNFDTVYNIRHRLRYRSIEDSLYLYVFSSLYYITPTSDRIGRQFMTAIDLTDLTSVDWITVCASVDLQGSESSTYVTTTLLEPNGVPLDANHGYTQSTKWVKFNIESKMVSNVYIDTFFYFNPTEVFAKTLTSSSPTFVDYRSNYVQGNDACTAYSTPEVVEPSKTNYIGEVSDTSYGGFKVKLELQEITLPEFIQAQGYDLKYSMKQQDGNDLPDIFIYEESNHKLKIFAIKNSQADVYDLKLIAQLAVDPTVYSEFPFQVEILVNQKPTFDTETSTANTVTFDEWLDYDIVVDLDDDTEDDSHRIIGAQLFDSGDQPVDKEWFSITKMTKTQVQIKVSKPLISGESDETYKVVVEAADIYNLEDPATYTITVNIDNINHKPYYSGTTEETVLQGWTVGSQSDPLPAIAISLFDDRDELDTIVFDATRLCEFQPDSSYFEFVDDNGDQRIAIKASQVESNAVAGNYKISCTVYDGHVASDPQTFTLVILPNSPSTKESGAAISDDYEIDVQDDYESYHILQDITTFCTDKENDEITFSLYFNERELDTLTFTGGDKADFRQLTQLGFDEASMESKISLDQTTKQVKIEGSIRDFGVNTYQFTITCKDEWNDSIVSIPFRIAVIDSESQITVAPQVPIYKFYKDDDYEFLVDQTVFDDEMKTVTKLDIVENRNSDPFLDYDKSTPLTVDCTIATGTKCKISPFDFGELTSADVKVGAYISGYVKATYNDDTLAFSPLTIILLPCGGACDECDADDMNLCTGCAGDLYLFEGDCRACPKGYYGDDGNECQQCNGNCLACTSSGKNLQDDSCECDTDNNKINFETKECVDDCEIDGYELSGDYCVLNKQSQIVSISQSTKADTITFNQLDDYVYYLAVVDPEGTAATFNVEYEVLHDSNPITNKKPFSLQPVTGKAPYNYKIVFTPADFDEQEIESGLYTYEIELTVSDDDSILNDNIYTISANIMMVGLQAPVLKPQYSTAFDTIFIGKALKNDVLIDYFEDDMADKLFLTCSKKPAVGVLDNDWISIEDIGMGVRISGDTEKLNSSYIGQYLFLCIISDGLHEREYTYTVQVIANEQILYSTLSPQTQVQNVYTVETYNLASLCIDPEGQPITRILTVNGTAYSNELFGSYLQWNSTSSKLTFNFNSNTLGNLYQFIMLCYDGINLAVNTEFNIRAVPNYPLILNREISTQIIKFTDTTYSVNITGLFTDPESQAYSTQIYGKDKGSLPAFVKNYINGVLTTQATYSQAGNYNVEIVGTDSFNQETTAPFIITLQGCYSNCNSCTAVEANECTSCKSDFYLFENTCYTSCPDGTYQDEEEKSCVKCPSSCKTCLPPNEEEDDQCLTCVTGYFYHQMECLERCPTDYYGDTVTSTCKFIESTVTPTVLQEYADCKTFLELFTPHLSEPTGVLPFNQMMGETIKCKNMKQCADGSTKQLDCQWTKKFAMQCQLSPKSNKVTIRVATNSMPDHCFDSTILFAKENEVDFEVKFNVKVSSLSKLTVATTTQALNYQCSSSWIDDSNIPSIYEYQGYSGINSKIVGITLNGVPLFHGSSELQYDAFFPKSYGLYRFPKGVDIDTCLGSAQYSSFYHYYSFSPCIIPTDFKTTAISALCSQTASCKDDLIKYMQSGLTSEFKATQQVVGIAKDGHKILGPFKNAKELWQPCDVDVCNGLQQNGEYFYVMTLFHPYTINCWGPSVTANSYHAQCSANTYVCGETPSYMDDGGNGSSSAYYFNQFYNLSVAVFLMASLLMLSFY